MPLKKLEHGALPTREAYSALLNLKTLVELAVTEAYTASMETVGLAINTQPNRRSFGCAQNCGGHLRILDLRACGL